MIDPLWKYMEERLQQKGLLPVEHRHGPVVTISREFGCGANLIANELLVLIKNQTPKPQNLWWRLVNKEIVKTAAEELEVTPDKIEYVFKAQQRKMLDEMLAALSSKYYKNDTKVRKTIMKVIKSYIEDGYVVLVGRGGVTFTREKSNAVNIYLQAPKEWRIQKVVSRYEMTPEKASEMIDQHDKERKALLEYFYGAKTDTSLFDVVYNTKTWKLGQIAESIFLLMRQKGFF